MVVSASLPLKISGFKFLLNEVITYSFRCLNIIIIIIIIQSIFLFTAYYLKEVIAYSSEWSHIIFLFGAYSFRCVSLRPSRAPQNPRCEIQRKPLDKHYIYIYVYLSIYLSVCLSIYLSMLCTMLRQRVEAESQQENTARKMTEADGSTQVSCPYDTAALCLNKQTCNNW